MDEHGFIRSVHRHLPKKGLTVWIEYKYLRQVPKRAGTLIVPSLRPQQLAAWICSLTTKGQPP